jgi:hypothetical protein
MDDVKQFTELVQAIVAPMLAATRRDLRAMQLKVEQVERDLSLLKTMEKAGRARKLGGVRR